MRYELRLAGCDITVFIPSESSFFNCRSTYTRKSEQWLHKECFHESQAMAAQ